jgi:hypothetical protein
MLEKIYTERRTRSTIVNNSNENSDVIVDEKFSPRAAILPAEAPTTFDSELKFFIPDLVPIKKKSLSILISFAA